MIDQSEILVSHKKKISKSQALALCKTWDRLLFDDLDLLQDLGLAYPVVTQRPLFYEHITKLGLRRC